MTIVDWFQLGFGVFTILLSLYCTYKWGVLAGLIIGVIGVAGYAVAFMRY